MLKLRCSAGIIAPMRIRSPIILIACQPKSASTFLSAALAGLRHARRVSLVPGFGRREQELSHARILRCRLRLARFCVAQHHLRYSEVTQSLIARHAITPVVLVRNLYDVVASLRDHVRDESPVSPVAYVTPEMRDAPDADLEQALAVLAVPWYLNFYMSWRECPSALWLDYADIAQNAAESLGLILARAGIRASAKEIEATLANMGRKRTRLNIGRSGRGENISRGARTHVAKLVKLYARHYPHDRYLASHLS